MASASKKPSSLRSKAKIANGTATATPTIKSPLISTEGSERAIGRIFENGTCFHDGDELSNGDLTIDRMADSPQMRKLPTMIAVMIRFIDRIIPEGAEAQLSESSEGFMRGTRFLVKMPPGCEDRS